MDVAQRIENIYRLITIPAVYNGLQESLGSTRARIQLVQEVLRPQAGSRVLDIGCGPGSLFPFLPKVDYMGLDLNDKHIAAAQKQFAGRATFRVGNASRMGTDDIGQFDLIIIFAILHHLSDGESHALFSSAERFLKQGGRIVTMDPVWVPRQRLIARILKKMDSGLNIRSPAQYVSLLDGMPFAIETHLYDDLLRVPYDHFCMTLTRKS